MDKAMNFDGPGDDAASPDFILDSGLDAAPIAPLLAGARARGMADALDMLGVAAVLVDAAGLALFANRRARGLFGPHLTIVDDRLKAGDEESQRALASALDALASDETLGGVVILSRGAGRSSLRLRVMGLQSERDDPFQLARGVVILDDKPAHAFQLRSAGDRLGSGLAGPVWS